MNIGELDGVKVMLSPEAYAEVKKQKIIEENKILKEQQQELERYKNIIEKIKKYVEENQEIKRFDGGVRDGEDYYILYNSDIILDIINKTNKENNI